MTEEISDIDDEIELDELSEYGRRLVRCRPANKAAIFDALAAAGIGAVEATFEGSDGSGRIEKVKASAGQEVVGLPETLIDYIRPDRDGDVTHRRTMTVRAAIEAFAYDALEQIHPAWTLEDGSYGDFTFNVTGEHTTKSGFCIFAARAVILDLQRRIMETDYSFHEF